MNALHTASGLDKLITRRNTQILARMYVSRTEDNVVQPTRALRANSKIKLKTSRYKKDIYNRSPLYRGVRLWDRLVPGQQQSDSKEHFLAALTPQDLLPLEPVVI